MAQQPIEIILARQWASHVSVAVFLLDAEGILVYYNDAAARLLGRPYEEVGDLRVWMLAETFRSLDMSGNPLPWDKMPISLALERRRPEYLCFRYQALDGVWHDVEVTAIPIEAVGGTLLGVTALFWEVGVP